MSSVPTNRHRIASSVSAGLLMSALSLNSGVAAQPVLAMELQHNLPLLQAAPEQPITNQFPPVWSSCGVNLLRMVGRVGREAQILPSLYWRNSVNRDDEFMEYLMAIIYVESGFDHHARSQQGARGLMQLTAPAIQDATEYCELRPITDMNRLYDSVTNIRYGTCFLKKIHEEVELDWTRTLILYNGGYAQLLKYERGESIASETANYVLKVQRAREICRTTN